MGFNGQKLRALEDNNFKNQTASVKGKSSRDCNNPGNDKNMQRLGTWDHL